MPLWLQDNDDISKFHSFMATGYDDDNYDWYCSWNSGLNFCHYQYTKSYTLNNSRYIVSNMNLKSVFDLHLI